ncbi:hypothetical protein L596_024373 [Steinernema carpocapsae]|uniref:Uncharacterized protein n=1 Tax=Steinernema carpocapsae TaxID=34508 RepID=A0A4U5MHA4_STECR|nr:hypothetical protein L596_024373 [Steinernema carpocapsae]
MPFRLRTQHQDPRRQRSPDQWKRKEGAEAADDLLEQPTGAIAAEVQEDAVSGASRASGTRQRTRTHADSGQNLVPKSKIESEEDGEERREWRRFLRLLRPGARLRRRRRLRRGAEQRGGRLWVDEFEHAASLRIASFKRAADARAR